MRNAQDTMNSLHEIREKMEVLNFEVGFLKGLLAASKAVKESSTLEEARAKITLIEIPSK